MISFNSVLSDQVYSLIGKPRFDDPKYYSLERMLRIYIGIHDRQEDINNRNTYYAFKILSVRINTYKYEEFISKLCENSYL